MTAPAPGLPQDVERARVAAWEAAHDSLRDDVLHNADGFDNDIVNHFLGMIDDADQRPYDHIAAHVAPPVSASFEEALKGVDVEHAHHTDEMITTHIILGLDDVRAAHRAEVDAAVARASTPTASNYLNVDALRERVEFLEKHAAQREAAHAEAVRVAVEAEGRLWDQACADVRDRTAEVWDIDGVAALCHDGEDAEAVRVVVKHRRAAAIRARGVAKPRTDGEAATRSGEGDKS